MVKIVNPFRCMAALLAFTGGALASDLPAEGHPPVDRVYSEVFYSGQHSVWWRPDRPAEFAAIYRGSGFIIMNRERALLVTAAHLYEGAEPSAIRNPEESAVRFGQVESRRIRVGSLSLAPERIMLDSDLDICILELRSEDAALIPAARFQLEDLRDAPQLREELEVWGYPGEQTAQLARAAVSSIQDDFFVVNAPFEGGFSGGPLLDGEGRLAGVLVRSTERQARALQGRLIRQAVQNFDRQAQQYSEGNSPQTGTQND